MNLIFSPLIYNSLFPAKANTKFYQYIQNNTPEKDFFHSQIESYENFHTCWISSRLGIGHTCGSNFTQEYSNYLSILGIPIFSATGCNGHYYRSALLIHRKYENLHSLHDVLTYFSSLTIAINSFGSNSGWFLFLSTLGKYCEEHQLSTISSIEKILQTGSHNANVLAIVTGKAQLTSVDCVSWALMEKYYPELVKDVKVIGWTVKALTPPFVTSRKHSVELQAILRDLLLKASQTNEYEVLKARQDMLLIGIDINENKGYEEEYFNIFNSNLERIKKYFPHFLANLRSGRLIRQHLNIIIPTEATTDRIVQVYSSGRIDDEHWPKADFIFQNYLRYFLYNFLFQKIVEFYNSNLIPFPEWSEENLIIALQAIVGREIWTPLPFGGNTKLILCSLKGTAHLLSVSPEVDSPSNENPFIVHSTVPKEWRERIFILAQSIYSHLDGRQSEIPSTLTFSGFMGCASTEVTEYFDTDDSNNGSPSLISELWAIDLALSEKLLENGESIGIYAYITAPRHNDRYDWGNLVIGVNEQAILAWRDTISHSSARKYIAPKSYEHIRIHRGLLTKGLNHPSSLTLQQTTFLEPKPVPTAASSSSGVSSVEEKERYDSLFVQHEKASKDGDNPMLTELNHLLSTKSHILNALATPETVFRGYDPSKTGYYFKRRQVDWEKEDFVNDDVTDSSGGGGGGEQLIPNVTNSLKINFLQDLFEMNLVK